MRKTLSTSAAVVAAAALTLGLAGTAHAEMYGVDDTADTGHGSDVLALQVRNGPHNLVVTTTHDNLRKAPKTGSGGAVYVDTDEDDQGPEYVFVGGFTRGTDYVLRTTDGFGPRKWGDPVEHGDYIMRVNYREETVRMKMSRRAIDDPSDVRVAVRVSGTRTDGTSKGLVDWVGSKRRFTPWIAQG